MLTEQEEAALAVAIERSERQKARAWIMGLTPEEYMRRKAELIKKIDNRQPTPTVSTKSCLGMTDEEYAKELRRLGITRTRPNM